MQWPKHIQNRHLVSLNTARIKLRNKHPRISNDLDELFEVLKYFKENPDAQIYREDGYLDIDR